jgi:hypothetical protein
MNIIKLILGIVGVIVLGFIAWLAISFVWSILWYLVFFGILGAVGYGGYKLFKKAEAKSLGSDPYSGIGTGDINMSWDEYDKKYLHK